MTKKLVSLFSNSSLFLILFLVVIGCDFHKNKYGKEISLLKNLKEINITDKTSKIFILSENQCLPCNKRFSKLMAENLKDENSIFVINATGNLIDISSFKEFNSKRVIFIKKYENDFFNVTKLIKLKNKEIDTIIDISYENVDDIMK